jgi:hypothetical protein
MTNFKETIELADYKVLRTNMKVSFKSKFKVIDWFYGNFIVSGKVYIKF